MDVNRWIISLKFLHPNSISRPSRPMSDELRLKMWSESMRYAKREYELCDVLRRQAANIEPCNVTSRPIYIFGNSANDQISSFLSGYFDTLHFNLALLIKFYSITVFFPIRDASPFCPRLLSHSLWLTPSTIFVQISKSNRLKDM